MGKKIRLTEVQFDFVIKSRLLKEYGQKGRWKSEWNEEDQILAMYNSLYGIEELGMSKNDIAEKIIGTSLASFNKQTSNFDFQHTGKGLNRPHELQTPVYKKYKDIPREEFKKICEQIINHRLENPEEAVTRKEVGGKIGSKRDSIEKDRNDALRLQGKDPSRFKIISSDPKDVPDDEEGEASPSSKQEVLDFLTNLLDRLRSAESKEDVQGLSGDVEFVQEYIDSEWMDRETEDMIAEAKGLYYKKVFPDINRMLNVMGL